MEINEKMIIVIIGLTFLLQLNCISQVAGIDENGNPIFNSIPIGENDYDGYGIAANYYTISDNIANPNSSVFVSKHPTGDQIFQFATNQPSYFWILHKDRKVFKIISLNQKSENWNEVKWSFFVQDINFGTGKEFPINIWMLHITEHRMFEMKYGLQKMLEQELMDKDKRIFNKYIENKIHGTVPYLKIYEKLLKLINDGKLYLPETNIENVIFVDDEEANTPQKK